MNHFRLLLITLFAVVSLYATTAGARDIRREDLAEALMTLDRELDNRDRYIEIVNARLDSLKQLRNADPRGSKAWFDHTMELADGYVSISNDSLLYYLGAGRDAAQAAGLDSLATAFDIKFYTYIPLYGYIDYAIKGYEKYDPEKLPVDLRRLYYASGKQLYSYVSAFYAEYPDISSEWLDKSHAAQLKHIALLDPASVESRLNRSESLILDRRYEQARAILEPLLEELPVESNLYARACHFMTDIAKVNGDHDGQMYYLARSALSDAIAPTFEVTSLQELGQLLYKDDDIDRAYRYLSIALDNAVAYNAILRQIQTSKALPVIQKANQKHDEQWRSLVYLIIVILAVLAFILLAALLFIRRQMRRMATMQLNLRKANKTQEVYINQFLTLCTIYIEKLKHYNDLVNRKLSAGQADELYKSTKTGRFIDEQVREFYNVFDDAFLHIYPTFVEDVNKLLQPDKQIMLREGELLNTDLRILAFMRLGIEDATRVAQTLNYSVNTIYTYRNKLRNRAVSRDTFEHDIMRTGTV